MFCLNCSKEITSKYGKKFCSQKCSAVFNNTGRGCIVNCSFCKKNFKPQRRNSSRLFCSRYCMGQSKQVETNVKILKGDVTERRTLKRFYIALYGHKCQLCNNTEWTGKPIPIILDHIDGHSENNNVDNLRLICPNCDALLPTYKSKNKGKGRAYRRQRYQEGKSY